MKTPPPLLVLLASIFCAAPLKATLSESYTYTGINQAIPDYPSVGLAKTQTLVSAIDSITSVTVTLQISGGFNGDLYGYLSHASGFSVLLNRTGKTSGNPIGYPDSGFNVTFSDTATNGDIHVYQTVVNPLGGTLLGTWQPDGRNVDPATVLDSSPRTAYLSSLTGLNADGDWTLFLADLGGGAQSTLNGWGLELQGEAVIPEPICSGTFLLLGLGGLGVLSRRGYRHVR